VSDIKKRTKKKIQVQLF